MTLPVRPASSADADDVLDLLRLHHGLEVDFEPSEFLVASDDDGEARPAIVACGRLRRHADGALELASVATRPGRHGSGLGSAIVKGLLAEADGPVWALALAPGFFVRHGFREAGLDGLPASVRAKADGMCASQPFVAMVRP